MSPTRPSQPAGRPDAAGARTAAGAVPSPAEPSTPGPVATPSPERDRWFEWVVRVGGTLVGCLLAAATAVVSAFLVPLRVFTVPVPVCWLVVAVGLAASVLFVRHVTGSRIAAALPAATWFAVLMPLTSRTTEGDVAVPGNWVGYGLLLAGAVGLAGSVFLAVLPAPAVLRRARVPVPTDRPPVGPAGRPP